MTKQQKIEELENKIETLNNRLVEKENKIEMLNELAYEDSGIKSYGVIERKQSTYRNLYFIEKGTSERFHSENMNLFKIIQYLINPKRLDIKSFNCGKCGQAIKIDEGEIANHAC